MLYFVYLLTQEELAFAFEMLGLYDEALVQYDELDALFTQFVLNSAVGGEFYACLLDFFKCYIFWFSEYLDAPKWLSSFQTSPNDWSGVCLNPNNSFNVQLRERIQQHTMSVIDFRNYLFARQAALLLIASKPSEVNVIRTEKIVSIY